MRIHRSFHHRIQKFLATVFLGVVICCAAATTASSSASIAAVHVSTVDNEGRTCSPIPETSALLLLLDIRGGAGAGGHSTIGRAASSISSSPKRTSYLKSSHRASSILSSSPWKLPFLGSLFGRKTTAQIYRESLEEQVLLLDRQLRQARTEVTQLREQQQSLKEKNQQNKRRRSSTSVSSSAERQQQRAELEEQRKQILEQRQQLKQLQSEIQKLEEIKTNLQTLLESATAKIADLETKLFEQEETTQQMKTKYEEKLQMLQSQLEEKQQAQLSKLEAMYEQRIQGRFKRHLPNNKRHWTSNSPH